MKIDDDDDDEEEDHWDNDSCSSCPVYVPVCNDVGHCDNPTTGAWTGDFRYPSQHIKGLANKCDTRPGGFLSKPRVEKAAEVFEVSGAKA